MASYLLPQASLLGENVDAREVKALQKELDACRQQHEKLHARVQKVRTAPALLCRRRGSLEFCRTASLCRCRWRPFQYALPAPALYVSLLYRCHACRSTMRVKR